MNKYIFLDLDGVLISNKKGDPQWTPKGMRNLGIILRNTNAKLIISSSHRKNNLIETIDYLREIGFEYCEAVVGITIRGNKQIKPGLHMSIPRGVEIKQWIDTHIHSENGKNYKKKNLDSDYTYVILDDKNDMLLEQRHQFIHINTNIGLSKADVLLAIGILNNVCYPC